MSLLRPGVIKQHKPISKPILPCFHAYLLGELSLLLLFCIASLYAGGALYGGVLDLSLAVSGDLDDALPTPGSGERDEPRGSRNRGSGERDEVRPMCSVAREAGSGECFTVLMWFWGAGSCSVVWRLEVVSAWGCTRGEYRDTSRGNR